MQKPFDDNLMLRTYVDKTLMYNNLYLAIENIIYDHTTIIKFTFG